MLYLHYPPLSTFFLALTHVNTEVRQFPVLCLAGLDVSEKTLLKADIMSLLSLHFSAENNFSSSCPSSESVPSRLFLELWSFLLLFSWNSAISFRTHTPPEVGYSKMGSVRMRKRSHPCQTLPLQLSMEYRYGKASSATVEQTVFKGLLSSAFRKLQFGLIVSFASINRHQGYYPIH